ncbi:MAG TPA: tetratricopeptide repeat protein, partial [Planctomycetota bacterium]|nr:tetratricopeptide repeat protein [Planctomycetota bacterium]
LYEAAIEAGMALREPALPIGARRDFLEMQARCAAAVGEHGVAADRYEAILAAYADNPGSSTPFTFAYALYDERVQAAQWDWILEHIAGDIVRYGNDALLRFARAAALEAKGRLDEAREEILDPYVAVSLGTKSLSPSSLRGSPRRRRDIAMLAYRLFTASGDSRAGSALDAVLVQSPDDLEALRLRSALALAEGRPDSAQQDAFAMLTRHRRDHADFQRWIDAADALSRQRYDNRSLAERAAAKVDDSERWQRDSDAASFLTFTTQSARHRSGRQEVLPDQLHHPSDPAFSFAIVEELVKRNNVPRARSELRKLSEVCPDVQEFRYRLGRLLVREGQYDFAADEFLRLLQDVPGDTEVLDLAARTEMALGRDQDAAALVNRTILDDPLGVGAVRYGQRLVDQGHADQAEKLIERLVRWTDYSQRPDVLVLAGRVQLALGKVPEAEAILTNVAAQSPDSVDVAMLGLDVGIAKGARGLVDAAVTELKPLAAELFPDQMARTAARLLQAKLYPEIVSVFDATVRELPAARPALRAVAEASKALGRFEDADALLGRLVGDDRDALVDRFILLGMRGEYDEASRRLRLDPVPAEQRPLVELLLLIGNAVRDIPALGDGTTLVRLEQLHAEQLLSPSGLQLMDALVRIAPDVHRLSDVLPHEVVDAPRETYPEAGRDVETLVALAKTSPDAARDLAHDLVYLLLFGDRPFWRRESELIAAHALSLAPTLAVPARALAQVDLDAGAPRDALLRLLPLLQTERPDLADVALFLRAARDFGHSEWGVAYALQFQSQPAVQRLLAETLLAWGHPEEARELLVKLVAAGPADAATLADLIRAQAAGRHHDEALAVIDRALADFPEDDGIVGVAAETLAMMPHPTGRAVELMTSLAAAHAGFPALDEALARAQSGDAAAVKATLERLLARLPQQPAPADDAAASQRGLMLVRAAHTARTNALPDLARELNNLALQIEPGAINLYRDLALLEREQGDLDRSRRYLEVLSFVDLYDREAAMDLARLDFLQLGEPLRAAEVVRRTFGTTMPPDAVEIVAAEAFLLGRPVDAIKAFYAVQGSPLVTADTYLTVARIAYAAGIDEIAKPLFDLIARSLPADDPRVARPKWLLERRLLEVKAPHPGAPAAGAGEATAGVPVVLPPVSELPANAEAGAPAAAGGTPVAPSVGEEPAEAPAEPAAPQGAVPPAGRAPR